MNLVSAGLLLFWGVYFALAGAGNVVDWLTKHGYRERYFQSSRRNFLATLITSVIDILISERQRG